MWPVWKILSRYSSSFFGKAIDEDDPLTTEQILCEEISAIHGKNLSEAKGLDLYRLLNHLNLAALCLSGGGIRSAAFALGVIQALATHPRSSKGVPVEKAEDSLLTKFHYLSTVSGGGYIGSWLSAWCTRDKFSNVWRSLVARPAPDIETPQIAWLRSYTNYLTPKLGLLSADSWAVVAIYIRNLVLIWLVFLPFLCALILFVKFIIALLVGISQINREVWAFGIPIHPGLLAIFVAFTGVVLLIIALRFAARGRPSMVNVVQTTNGTPFEADQIAFLAKYLLPSLFSAICFAQLIGTDLVGNLFQRDILGDLLHQDVPTYYHPLTGWLVPKYSAFRITVMGAMIGVVIYTVGWICGWSPRRDIQDFASWIMAGATYGVLVGVWFYFYLQIPPTVPGEEDSFIISIINSPVFYLIFGVAWILFAQWCGDVVFVGLSSYRTEFNEDQEWLGRAGGWLLVTIVAWVLLTFLTLAGFLTLVKSPFASTLFVVLEFWVGPIVVLAGIMISIVGSSNFSGSYVNTKGVWSNLTNIATSIAAPLFVGALIFGLSIGLDALLLGVLLFDTGTFSLRDIQAEDYGPWLDTLGVLIIGFGISMLIGSVASLRLNINRFSLHALYRNRLTRAFLGASRRRRPNPFSGFDKDDSPTMRDLWPKKQGEQWPSIDKSEWRPFHIVNITLNIVSAKKLAWQERKAASFIVSPLHCGMGSKVDRSEESDTSRQLVTSGETGTAREPRPEIEIPVGAYRRSEQYGDPHGGISLGTAMAISGAAANPNMGYHSSPAITLLMAMLNVRLGWWLGNPGKEGDKTYKHEGPSIAILPLLQETFGLTTDSRKYIHLSDGGHFENLGLYEMVRRRCRFILICDAGRDPRFVFEDLGNAARKVFIDFGISIRFGKLQELKPRGKELDDFASDHAYHVIGEIDYQSVDPNGGVENGIILYVKAGYHGSESAGIRSYAMANPEFPHQNTANQWFTESQFEAYRSLGFEIVDGILRPALDDKTYVSAPSWETLCAALRAGLKNSSSAPRRSFDVIRVA